MSTISGLLRYYKFEGTSGDSTPYGFAGSDTNITYSTGNGKLGQGAGFSGNSPGTSKIILSAIPELQNSSYFSFSCWVKYTSITDNVLAGQYAATGPTANQWFLGVKSTGAIRADVSDGSNDNYGDTTTGLFTTGVWYHIAMVYDGTQSTNATRLVVYLNGVQQTLTFTGTIPSKFLPSGMVKTTPLWLGTLQTLQSTQTLNGAMDEVGIWNKALNYDEVNYLYNNTYGISYPLDGKVYDCLVVGGGGGGGASGVGQVASGGGGAGGYNYKTSMYIGTGAHSVVVGTGGAGGVDGGNAGTSGNPSSFNGQAAGGGGGGVQGSAGANGKDGNADGTISGSNTIGGSGGGGCYPSKTGGVAGTYGNAGGNGGRTGGACGGGGGSSGVGVSWSSVPNGGNGTANSISGASVTYASGGGGGAGSFTTTINAGTSQTGGNGGALQSAGSNATANTGGGGGGGGNNQSGLHGKGGDGASGIVIISYTTGSMLASGGSITYSGGKTIHTFTSSGTFYVKGGMPVNF